MNGHHRTKSPGQNSAYGRLRPYIRNTFTGEQRLQMSDGTQKAASLLKDRARRIAGELSGEVMGLAQALLRSPELSGEEEASARLLAGALEQSGFEVEIGAGGLPTAFVARSRTAEGPVLAFLA